MQRISNRLAAIALVGTLALVACGSATPEPNDSPPAGSAADETTQLSTTAPVAGTSSVSTRPTGAAGTAHASPGSVVYPTSPTSVPPRPTTAASDTVLVTEQDNGKTFTLRQGQQLVVTLDDGSSIWSTPDTDNAAALPRTAVSANPSATHVTASFHAKSAGQAHVSASKDLPCRNAQPPCMAPTQLWQITVIVQP